MYLTRGLWHVAGKAFNINFTNSWPTPPLKTCLLVLVSPYCKLTLNWYEQVYKNTNVFKISKYLLFWKFFHYWAIYGINLRTSLCTMFGSYCPADRKLERNPALFCIQYRGQDTCQIMLLNFPFMILTPTSLQSQADVFSRGQSHHVSSPFLAAEFCLPSWLLCSAVRSNHAAACSLSEGGTTEIQLTAMSPGGCAPLANDWHRSKTWVRCCFSSRITKH